MNPSVQVGFMAARPGVDFIARFLKEYYDEGKRPFIDAQGQPTRLIPDGAMLAMMERDRGLRYVDAEQRLDGGILLHPSSILSTSAHHGPDSVAIHWYDQTWNKEGRVKQVKKWVKRHLWWLYRLRRLRKI